MIPKNEISLVQPLLLVGSQFLVGLLGISVCLAAITKYHRLSDLNNRILFLRILEVGKSKIKVLERELSF